MMRILKNIKLLVFLLVEIAIISHAVIPHDHHYDNEIESAHHKKDNGNLVHCYYLNHINSDKIANNNLLKIVKHLSNLVAVIYNQEDTTKKCVSFTHNKTIKTSFLDVISHILPIRGSPVL